MDRIEYTASELRAFTAGLDHRQLLAAVRGTMRRAGRTVRRAAIKNLTAAHGGVRNISAIGRSIRVSDTRKLDGFYVSASNHVYYKTERGVRKPLPLWLNTGTSGRVAYKRNKSHKVAYRGSTPGSDYMGKTFKEQQPRMVEIVERAYNSQINAMMRKTLKNFQ